MKRMLVSALLVIACSPILAEEPKAGLAKVSYSRQIAPIFQANCVGCHQPAKAGGDYVMTDFAKLLAGVEDEKKPVVPGHPETSFLVKAVTPDAKGKAYMPENKKPLGPSEIDLIKTWIAEGASDDTPANAKVTFDADHPPTYTRQPVICALDFSPNGQLLAVAGFHEVILWKADGSAREGRLIGLSERIQSLRFSPDGKRLAVAGGLPGRMGEIQIWNVEKRELKLSKAVTFDTLFGVSWSPDSTKVAFGCADNTVRAIDATTGEQVLFQGSHSDWAIDTCFTNDGANVVSVSRDRSVKLTELATQRFVDNITSITPGALKGGLLCVARHPQREEIVIGGSDGQPKIYRVHRTTARKIGDDANLIRDLPAMVGRVNALAVSADGKKIAAVSSLDGRGQISIYGYEFQTEMPADIKAINEKVVGQRTPAESKLLADYQTKDVKRPVYIENVNTPLFAVGFQPDGKRIAAAGADGLIRLIDAQSGSAVKEFAAVPELSKAEGSAFRNSRQVAVAISDAGAAKVDFIRDIEPILSRMGCNAGTCHGSAQGKNGFKLSLRGYDPIFDIRALTDELASRRVNIAAPDNSLMLLKITNAVPHVGGQLTKPGEAYYNLIRDWIADGATIDLGVPRVVGIEVTPKNPIIEKIGDSLQLKVIAKFADGKTRDVTREAFLDSGNTEGATVDRTAKVTAIRRGEAPVLARYEGAYAATTLTVMGDRSGFVWKEPAKNNRIDELVAAKWKRMKIRPSELCSDTEFLRRVSLDLTGLPPTVENVRQFIDDTRETSIKRKELIDKLIGSPEYVEYWTNKWADLLQVNRKYLGAEGASAFRAWIRNQVDKNTPYDEFAAKILTAKGSNKDNPPASYYKILREPTAIMENTTHLFLGVRFNCNKCHDHPFERWTQDQYYETAAYFARVDLKPDPKAGAMKIGGTAVEGAKPLYEIVEEKPAGEVKHDRTGLPAAPKFPYPSQHEAKAETRREELSAWITSPDNQFFARSLVNRLWGYTFGIGIIEPIDDIRAGNPPTNPELLDYLTKEFVDHKFDTRHILKLIVSSRTYQLSIETNKWNEDDRINFSRAAARRLPAEVLFDALERVTGAKSHFPGVREGMRAAELPDSGIELPDGFLNNLGRPVRESACECERSTGLQLGPVMALVNGRTIGDAIAQEGNALSQLVAREKDDRKVVAEIFLRVLNRPATEKEIDSVIASWSQIDSDHARMVEALALYEKELAPRREKAEADRLTALERAKKELAQYERELAPVLKKREEERLAKLKEAEAKFAAFDAEFQKKIAVFEKKFRADIEWTILDPKTFKGVREEVVLKKDGDKSIMADKAAKATDYTVTAETDAKAISAIRLEVLSHPKLPNQGPGLSPSNGNFVLSQFEASVQLPGGKVEKLLLKNAKADFQQDGYPAAYAIDGQTNSAKGWAVSPAVGMTHWITFELDKPIEADGIKKFSFVLQQRYNGGNHNIGRFRISVAASKKPVGLSVSEEWKAILKTPADKRTAEQKEAVHKYFELTDPSRKQQLAELAMAKQPLPKDAHLTELQERVEFTGKPLPPDALQVQMRQDLATSASQLANKRLTGAQDLVWALVNSPSFLFNR